LFGVFFGANFIFPFFMNAAAENQHFLFISTIRLIGATLCCLLMVREKWSPTVQPYLPNFWHITIMYCLPFYSTIMFLLTNASIEWVINIAVAIILLLMVVDWVTALILGFVGIVVAYSLYRVAIGDVHIALDFTAGYLLVYQGVFGILIGLLFARRKEQNYDQLAVANQVLSATEKETRQASFETFLEKINLIKTLKNADIQKLSTSVKDLRTIRSQAKKSSLSMDYLDKELKGIESAVSSVALALTRVDQRALDYMRLDVKPILIEQLLEQLQSQLPSYPLHYSIQTQQQQIVCDSIQLIKVLKNTIVVLSNKDNSKQSDCYLTIQDTHLAYPLPKVNPHENHVQNLSAIRITISQQEVQPADMSNSYAPDMSGSALPNPTNEQAFLLTINQRIIKAHYGYTNVDVSKQITDSYYLYVIPVDVTEIRPPDMNAPNMELGVELKRANDNYPGAKEKERAFLTDVQQRSSADIEQVERAIEIIKRYHGSVVRKSGEPYYLHPLAVAHIVLDWNQEEATILGALLHDTIEDTPMLLEDIDRLFGPEVATIVDYVSHFVNFKNSFYMGKLTNFDNKSMLLQATDRRALYVKVADRLHNMRTITGHSKEEKRKAIANETLEFFVPIAMSLKLDKAAQELLDISNRVLRTGK
jgi:hypothetical protein